MCHIILVSSMAECEMVKAFKQSKLQCTTCTDSKYYSKLFISDQLTRFYTSHALLAFQHKSVLQINTLIKNCYKLPFSIQSTTNLKSKISI